jgi:hypothetical protein
VGGFRRTTLTFLRSHVNSPLLYRSPCSTWTVCASSTSLFAQS